MRQQISFADFFVMALFQQRLLTVMVGMLFVLEIVVVPVIVLNCVSVCNSVVGVGDNVNVTVVMMPRYRIPDDKCRADQHDY